ncbi:hypothetical protein AALP_AA1G061500 [Arabis alpina]|uniref:Uncharacterized protein n=1 Tax=Arabis alpina TaxID=50452 RepID=A0A087HLF8_ARAAL|nr:hypothetical protein AALP_AA1G061500 [Arabis alpina]
MEEKKMKSVASIPANYVSILQLQERWMREKERKQKKEVNEQRRREEDVVKVVEESMEVPSVKLEEKGFISKKVSAIVSKEEENGGEGDSKKKKKKRSKKKNVKEIVKCEPKVSPAYIPRKENSSNPVKEIASKDSVAEEETQFQDLWIKKRVEEKGREFKVPERLNNGQSYVGKNQRQHWSSTRVVRETTTTRTMVWVKKG